MLGTIYENSSALSYILLDHKRIVQSPNCTCRHSYFRPKQLNNERSYSSQHLLVPEATWPELLQLISFKVSFSLQAKTPAWIPLRCNVILARLMMSSTAQSGTFKLDAFQTQFVGRGTLRGIEATCMSRFAQRMY